MCEHSNASTVAALREARRRKILENSANRLKLIEGINSSHTKIEPETFLEPRPEPEVRKTSTLSNEIPSPKLNSKLNDLIRSNKELKEISDFLLKDNVKVNGDEVEDEEEEEEEEEEEGEADVRTVAPGRENPFLKLFLQKRLHYVILALIVNFLFLFNVGYLFYENVFCPFYSLKAVELISRKGKRDIQPVLSLVVAGLPKKVQNITKTILFLSEALLSDLCIYLFTFIVGSKVINYED